MQYVFVLYAACVYVCTYVYVLWYVCMYVCMYALMCSHTYIHTHIYICHGLWDLIPYINDAIYNLGILGKVG